MVIPTKALVLPAFLSLLLLLLALDPAGALAQTAGASPTAAPAAVKVPMGTPTPLPAPLFSRFPDTNDAIPTDYSKAAPDFPDQGLDWKFGGGARVQVQVDPSQVLAPVTPYSFGCNLAWYDGKDWL